ncbi:MAG: TonB-dependent receptor [Pseudomonadota bacterium]
MPHAILQTFSFRFAAPRGSLWRVAVAVSVFIAWPMSHAQKLEEIQVTATRGVSVTGDVVNAVSVVDDARLEELQPALITDALQGAPGVFVQQTTPGQGTAIVRGLKGSEILHLVDGMRLNNALFRNAPNQYLALVDPFIIGRSEVVRGPLSSLYGSDAMGGVVQLFSSRPEYGGDEWSFDYRTRLTYDSANLGRSFNAGVTGGYDGLSAGAAITYQAFDDVRAAERREQVPTAFDTRAASAFVRMTDRAEREWDLSVQYLEQDNTPRYDELVPGFGQTEAASEVFLFSPNARLFVHGVHRSEGHAPWLDQFEAHIGFQQMTDGRRTRDLGSDRLRVEDNRSDLYGLTLQGVAQPMGRHQFSYGLDFYYDEVSSTRVQTTVSTGDEEVIRARFPDGSTMRNIDAYVHDSILMSDRVLLDAGLRLSNANVELTATDIGPAATVSNTDVSGSFGFRYEWTDSLTGIANLARGFRAPNIFDLGTLGARPGNRFNIANPSLGPETVLTGELGIRIKTGGWDVEAVLWGSDYQDKIVSVFTGTVDANGRDIVQSQNASTVQLVGGEVAVRYAMDAHDLSLTVAHTRGETETEDGEVEPSDRIPPLNGRAAWRFTQDNWWTTAELMFAAEQNRLNSRDVRDPRINPEGTPAWGSLNVGFGYSMNKNWQVITRFENILDRDYRRHGSGVDAPGRSVRVSVEGSF